MIIDSHVHLFPHRLAEAVRAWFDTHAWKPIYRDEVAALVERLEKQGISRMVALPYAHKPGMAEALNAFTREVARAHPAVVPCCTVFPGEPDTARLLDRALGDDGFAGVKIHCHVMKIGPDDPRMDDVWRASAKYRKPIVIHAGREPATTGYGIHVHDVSGAERVRAALRRHPDAIAIVPHLGGDEYAAFEALLGEFENLHLDTAMVIGGYFPNPPDAEFLRRNADRLLYGSDYPNLPYLWNTEFDVIRNAKLDPAAERKILHDNAARLFGIG